MHSIKRRGNRQRKLCRNYKSKMVSLTFNETDRELKESVDGIIRQTTLFNQFEERNRSNDS